MSPSAIAPDVPAAPLAAPAPTPTAPRPLLVRALRSDAALAAAVAVLIAGSSFVAVGGGELGGGTVVQLVLILLAGGLCAAAIVVPPRHSRIPRVHGAFTVASFALLAAITALSIRWSFAPGESWIEANRTLSYLAAFAGALALSRLAPGRWAALLGGVALGCVTVCSWALLTKVFPGALAADETVARLQAPFGYWNALGLMGAMAVPPLLWLAAKRSGNLAVNALSYPGLGLVAVTVLLSYSRGALIAIAAGVVVWMLIVPLRLRAVAAAAAALLCSVGVVAWAFAQPGITEDGLEPALRAGAGHGFGLLLLVMVLALLTVGLAAGFLTSERPPALRSRRRVGRALVAALALVPIIALVALAAQSGGISGQVSRSWDQLVNPAASTPGNDPSRLTATSSVRARYFREAADIFADHVWKGTGAGTFDVARTRYRTGALDVQHAHGYVAQTLADLGLLGMGASLLLCLLWTVSAARTIGLRWRDRGLFQDAERVGMSTMACVVVVFVVHSLLDWTWFVPGTAVVALLCAGWVAGRGPLRSRMDADLARARRRLVRSQLGHGAAARRQALRSGRGAGTVMPAVGGVVLTGTDPRTPALRPAGPWRVRVGAALDRIDPVRATAAIGTIAIAAVLAWTAWQPLRALRADDEAGRLLQAGDHPGALAAAERAVRIDPVSVDRLQELASIQDATGARNAALSTIEQAVRLQPADAQVWRRLAQFRLERMGLPELAVAPLRTAYYLDPESTELRDELLTLDRSLQAAAAARNAP